MTKWLEQMLKISRDTISPSCSKSVIKEESVFVASNEKEQAYFLLGGAEADILEALKKG